MMIEVLFESPGVLAVYKPAGIPTQAPPGIASVESLVRSQRFGEAFESSLAAGQRRHPGGFLGVPHRLDRAVSGVLLLAITPRAARHLSRQFERRYIVKNYLALVSAPTVGGEAGQAFEWRDIIRKVTDEPRAEVVPEGTAGGQEAFTRGRVVSAEGDRLLLSLEPSTGRMHQLRVQAGSRGMPVLGDLLYGGQPFREARDERSSPIALHAWRIRYTDPDSSQPIDVTCPLPQVPPWDEWTAVIDSIHGITR